MLEGKESQGHSAALPVLFHTQFGFLWALFVLAFAILFFLYAPDSVPDDGKEFCLMVKM